MKTDPQINSDMVTSTEILWSCPNIRFSWLQEMVGLLNTNINETCFLTC